MIINSQNLYSGGKETQTIWTKDKRISLIKNNSLYKTLTLKENGKDKKFRNKKTVEKLQILNPNTKSIPFRNGPL